MIGRCEGSVPGFLGQAHYILDSLAVLVYVINSLIIWEDSSAQGSLIFIHR